MVKDVYTTGEVAKICRVTIRTVIKWFESGALKGFRIPASRDRRIPHKDLVEFMSRAGFPSEWLEGVGSGKRRLLIADDEPGIVEILKEQFTRIGIFEVEVAQSGFEAGLKTRDFRPELILLDYNLGDLNGLEVTRQIKSVTDLKSTRVIVMSGYLKERDVKKVLEAGVDGFIRKPFKFEDVRDRVFHLLGITG